MCRGPALPAREGLLDNQMLHSYVVPERTPVSVEHLDNQASVAFLGSGFGAEQRNLSFEILGPYLLQRFPLLHQFKKGLFILRPVAGLAIGVADFRAGRKEGLVRVLHAQNAIEEEGKIGVFRKSRQLPDAVLPNVDKLLDAGLLKQAEEFFRRLLGKPDRKER